MADTKPLTPPPGLSPAELNLWLADQAAQDEPEEVTLPEMAGAIRLGVPHKVHPPNESSTPEYRRLYPFFWFACQHRDRATDEAMLLEGHCDVCMVLEWKRRRLPVKPLPPLPAGAPCYRDAATSG